MNLVEELGRRYFAERFDGSFFKGPDGSTCIVAGLGNDGILANKVAGTVSKPALDSTEIPNDFFVDMSVFATPELGWRSAAQGKYLAFFSRNNRSYHRGTSHGNLHRDISPLSYWAAETGALNLPTYNKEATTAKLVMEPEYLSLTEGLAKLAEGELLSFCISANMAVFPEEEEMLALMFNNRKVGTVNLNGEITCNIPFIRSTLEEQT